MHVYSSLVCWWVAALWRGRLSPCGGAALRRGKARLGRGRSAPGRARSGKGAPKGVAVRPAEGLFVRAIALGGGRLRESGRRRMKL